MPNAESNRWQQTIVLSGAGVRSRAEFVAKMGIVEEEADETAFWLELIIEGGLIKKAQVEPLLQEAGELVAIMAASRKSAIANRHSAIS